MISRDCPTSDKTCGEGCCCEGGREREEKVVVDVVDDVDDDVYKQSYQVTVSENVTKKI